MKTLLKNVYLKSLLFISGYLTYKYIIYLCNKGIALPDGYKSLTSLLGFIQIFKYYSYGCIYGITLLVFFSLSGLTVPSAPQVPL